MFTSSQSWTVPAGVSSAFVTMAGGGGSGAGWRLISATVTGSSGGYVFSQPINFVAGETIQVIVGKGAVAYRPVYNGSYWVQPAGDDGLSGYPGTASMLVSPSMGTLLECDGGSGAYVGGLDNYSGPIVAGNIKSAQFGSGYPSISGGENRVASGPYATPGGPGACGATAYGIGNQGTLTYSLTAGNKSGGRTPFGYGSGGDINVQGCHVTTTVVGTCIAPLPARDGIVFIDVLY